MFADCGAFQFRNESVPILDDAPLNADVAWERYCEAHLDRSETWDEVLLCSLDHIITQDMEMMKQSRGFRSLKIKQVRFLTCVPHEKTSMQWALFMVATTLNE